MTKRRRYLISLLTLILLVLSWMGFRLYQELNKRWSEDPLVWEADIAALEAADSEPLPRNAVVFVGSSSIRFWQSLAEDMAPIPVIRRGFGGAKLNDLVYYADRLVNVHQPAAVVVFAGSNDITPGDTKTPEQLLTTFKQLVVSLRAKNQELPIYYVAITPSKRRFELWPRAQAANAAIKNYTEQIAGLHFIDTNAGLLGDDGKPDSKKYRFDGLHLSSEGYKVWTEIIRDRLATDHPQYLKKR